MMKEIQPVVMWTIDDAVAHAVAVIATLAARPELTPGERAALTNAWCSVMDVQCSTIRRLYPALLNQKNLEPA